jgi:uncharacterized protein (TIGR00369 family)
LTCGDTSVPVEEPREHNEHWRKLERMYLAAPTNEYYQPSISIGEGIARIEIAVKPEFFHAAGGVHGSVYFKALDDAAFFAASSKVTDVFVLTTSFQLHFLRPVSQGQMIAEGRVVHSSRRLLVCDAELMDSESRTLARGTGTFMRSQSALGPKLGYL